MIDLRTYSNQYAAAFAQNPKISDIKPSEWAEKNVILPGNKGRVNYDFNPYCRKIIDCFDPNHPARKIAVMKGSQITFSSGVLIPLLGYIIAEDPHNTYMMVGTSDLIKPAMEKVDFMIGGAKLQKYIGYQSIRKKNNKSGDTDEIKNFANGYLKLGAATNPKSIAQVDLERILLDDFEAIKGNSKAAGNFKNLIEMRAAASMNTYKLGMISTPLSYDTSNIEPAYNAGNRERYFVECQCCHEPIVFEWDIPEGHVVDPLTGIKANNTGGIIYEPNHHGQIIEKSVGFVCYLCGGFFRDNNKQQMIREAYWKATAVPTSEDYYSFHISSLYAPTGMFNWFIYAGKHFEAGMLTGHSRDEYKVQVFMNTCEGKTYRPQNQVLDAKGIMRNSQPYEIGTVPNELSISQGNGRIVLLTFESDCNGTVKGVNKAEVDDARLDWEILAHSESGTTYSVAHGSVGTFIPRENQLKEKVDRLKWTYELNKPNSVWPEVNRIARARYNDEKGYGYICNMPGVDVGAYSDLVCKFIDWTIGQNPENPFVGMRGNKEEAYLRDKANTALFQVSKARNDVYYLQVGLFKDRLANFMRKKYDPETDEKQPPDFMNYPQPANGLYSYAGYFEHYETEQRKLITNPDGSESFRWVKIGSGVQNHFFDVRVYGLAGREIIVAKVARDLKEKEFTWTDYCNYVLGK